MSCRAMARATPGPDSPGRMVKYNHFMRGTDMTPYPTTPKTSGEQASPNAELASQLTVRSQSVSPGKPVRQPQSRPSNLRPVPFRKPLFRS